jgi:poly-gamma-glutamate synthase PgsB/CapB
LWIIVILTAALVALGVWEYQLHRLHRRALAIRIHVNGTRGKSSVTRLIAGGLRGSGIRTLAKTTGSRPRIILDDGSEFTVQRQGRANIIEQVKAMALAARRRCQAVVLECMALQPFLQHLCEHRLLRSTVGVITNARADHLDVMGPTVKDVARALAGTVPATGPIVTAETDPELLEIFAQAARRNGVQLVTTTPEAEGIDDQLMRRFSYVEHPENVALALRACLLAGAERQKALEGMIAAEPDIGVLRVLKLAFYAKEIYFVNALAANDPDSTLMLWNRIRRLYPAPRSWIALLNCRADRPHRSVQLGEILIKFEGLDQALLSGSGTHLAYEAALKAGLGRDKLHDLEKAAPAAVFERALSFIPESGVVFGMGNIGGGGNEIVEFFSNRAFQPGKEP